MKNRELFFQVALVVLALAATSLIMQDLLSLENAFVVPITQQLTGIQAAYGTGGQDPTPTPFGNCTWDCSSCDSPEHCTTSENDDNWSSVSHIGGGICFGAAASRNQCCGGIDWNNKGVYFQLIQDADVTVWKDSSDYDAFCDSWDGWWIDHDDNEDFEDIDARFPHSKSVTGVIAFCECPCDEIYISEHLQPTSSGFLYFCYTTVTIKKNGNEDYEIHWDVNPKLSSGTSSQLCAAPTWGNDARISIEGVQTDGGTGSMILTDLQPGWTGCAQWDGSFYEGGKWDETYLHVALSQNSITNIEASTALDYCYQTTFSDLGGDLLIPACGGGSGCSLGSRGGGPQGQGFSMCSPPFQTPINVLFPEPRLLLGWNLGSELSPFGEYSPLAHHSVFMFVAPDSQAGSYYHLYQGAQSIRTVKKWSDTHFINDKGIIEATSEISGSDTILRWDIGDYRYQFRGPTSEEWYIQSISLRNTGSPKATWGYTNGNLTTIDFADTTNDISLNWDTTPTPNKLVKINYPGNIKEEFKYNSGVFYGVEQTIGATPTPIARIQFTEDGYNRPSAIKGYSVSGAWPGTLQTQNDYTYKSQYDDRLDTYERFGNTYTVTDTDTTHTVTNPDESYVQETTSGDSTTTTVTTAVVGKDDEQLSSTVVVRNRAHNVAMTITDASSNVTEHQYRYQIDQDVDDDLATLIEKSISPADNYSQFSYDSEDRVNRLSRKTSGNLEKAYVQFDYDGVDRITKIYTGTLSETYRQYTGDLLTRITDGENRKTFFDYNGSKQLVAEGDGTATTTYQYDSRNRLELITSPSGIQTKYIYDSVTGNLERIYSDFSHGTEFDTQYLYDRNDYGDNLAKVTDAEGRSVEFEYDSWGRLWKEKALDGGNWRTITYSYNASMGEYLDNKVDMVGNKTLYEYYAPGFLKKQTWNEGLSSFWGSVEYFYDEVGRLAWTRTIGGDCGCNRNRTFVYTVNSRLDNKSAVHDGRIEYGYDGIDRLNAVNIPYQDGAVDLNIVGYDYDAVNRLTVITASVTATPQPRVDIAYNKANQITQMGFGAANPTATPVYKITHSYNSTNGRLISTTYDGSSTSFDRYAFQTYNSDGLRMSTGYRLRAGGTAFIAPQKVNYEYDYLNRLTREYCEGIGPSTCINLDGTGNGKVTIASGGDLAGSFTQMTVDMRFKLDSSFGAAGTLFERGASGSHNWVRLYVDANKYVKLTVETDSDNETVTVGPVPVNRWMHVAGTFDGNDSYIKLMLNGVGSDSHVDGTVGTYAGSPLIGLSFKGRIDEVHVRNVVDPTYNMYTNYTSGASTLGLWHFNTGSGSTEADDDSGSAQTGTLGSGASWVNNNGEVGVGRYERDYRNGYDDVGNREQMILSNNNGTINTTVTWKMTFNALNQLTQRHNGTDWTNGTERYTYSFDYNGNLKEVLKETKPVSTWGQVEKWKYYWNPRDQLERVVKFTTTANNVGSVRYEYCLSCDGALSKRLEFGGNTGETEGTLLSGLRYEYDGLNLLRVDELYDSDSPANGLQEDDGWRRKEVNTHKLGAIGVLIHKRVFGYASGTSGTPNSNNDYTYTYDPVGNVQVIYNANSAGRGTEVYYFTQDAFGNELSDDPSVDSINRVNLFGGTRWSTARTTGITEHQTGKWKDSLTEFYYFNARWYDPLVGRFVSRDIKRSSCGVVIDRSFYTFCGNVPTMYSDESGEICTPGNAGRDPGLYLCTRRVTGSFGLFGHCFVMYDCNGGCTTWSRKKEKELTKIIDGWENDDGDIARCIKVSECSNCTWQCLQDAAAAYSGDGRDYRNLPIWDVENSNTAASCLLHRCGHSRKHSLRCGWGWAPTMDHCRHRFNNPIPPPEEPPVPIE